MENGWKNLKDETMKEIFDFSEKYKEFLNLAKTEREFVEESKKIAEKHGFKDVSVLNKLDKGDKVYFINRGKNIVLAVIGEDDIEKGANFVVSHVDVPRLDLKQNPLYEDTDFALMKTHYYGGIKKYQWLSIPLALRGVIVLKSGEKINISVGDNEGDPVFTIPDILPHLSRKVQDDKKAREVVSGENLNILVGSIPSQIEDEKIKNKVKYTVLEILNREHGIIEEDFISAELEVVPAIKAQDVGFDRALLGAYGHDDRICGYTSLEAILNLDGAPKRTAICYITDKEEIGSTGSTGLQSKYIEYFMAELIYKLKENYNEFMLKKCLWNSKALSADVNAGLNPLYKSVHDEQNAAKLGYGIVVTKYTGHGGKSASNDADAEFVFEMRKLLDDAGIKWQTGLLGKVDEGGGGTVAKFLAHYGIKTIDAGPALIAMHSPFEVASKLDIYESYRTYKVFFGKM